MKQWIIREAKGPNALEFVDADKPVIQKPNEVLVRMHALSLNARDALFTQNKYPAATPPPEGRVVASDGAGEVVAVGDAVSLFKVGDRVTPMIAQGYYFTTDPRPEDNMRIVGFRVDGVAREYLVAEEGELLHVPEHMTYEEAATLSTAATTAWNSLYAHSPKLRPGQTVLCMGTGGVSLFAAQIALLGGARVIVTSSSDEKLKAARRHLDPLVKPNVGTAVIQTINYRTHPDWEKEVEKLAPGGKCDFVIEIGGMLTLGKSVQSTKQGGLVAISGFLSSIKDVGDDKILKDDIAMRILFGGVNVRGTFFANREAYREMISAFEVAGVKPIIDKVYKFEQLREAYEYSLSGSHFGKIVVTIA